MNSLSPPKTLGREPLSGVVLGDGTRSLAELLRGDRDQWRFLKSLDQSSPWDAFPGLTSPEVLQEINFQGKSAIGMLWAKQNESSILSFPFPPSWGEPHVPAQFREMNEEANVTSTDVQIPNLSRPEHVATHRALITNYGRTLSESSVVYRGDGFVVCMYVNDHPLPHFHVLGANAPETLARYTIETLDLMSGELPGALRKRVREWARRRRNDLMQCWERCRTGRHPFQLED